MSDDEDFSASFARFMRIASRQAEKQLGEPQHGFSIDVPSTVLRQRLIDHANVMRAGIETARGLPTKEQVMKEAMAARDRGESWESIPTYRPDEVRIQAVELRVKFLIDYASFMTDTNKVYRMHPQEWMQLFDRYDLPLLTNGSLV